jgi:hypothetical protein
MPKEAVATLYDPNYVYGMKRLSETLQGEGISHAFVGGTAVQALCCYLNSNKGAHSIKDIPYTRDLRPTDDYDIIALADEKKIKGVLKKIQGMEEIVRNKLGPDGSKLLK